MVIDLNPETILLGALISQGIFAAVILFIKEENREANRFLSLLILLMCLWLCDSFFRVSGLYNQNPDLYFLPIYFSLGFGPLIYFYTRSQTATMTGFSAADLIHFIPVFIQFFFYLYLQTQDYAYRRDFWLDVHKPYIYDLELILSFLSLMLYLYFGLKMMLQYRSRIENNFSSLHRINLNWLKALHFVLLFVSLVWMTESLIRLIWNYYPTTPFSTMSIALTLLFIAGGAILQRDLSDIRPVIRSAADEKVPATAAVIDEDLKTQIQELMDRKELYLRQELTLDEFAGELGYRSREVSQTINQGIGLSFVDFVNTYRIEKFKELAVSEDMNHLSLLGLAVESGFNSKSTFNRVFKKMEGMSPSEFQEKARNRN